ncbi:MAG: molybdopterin-binding protein [Beijerinckiaceae bacterium]|nr:molybdopterin-binding protein [Beijerinckiaceae bacterium]
MTTGHDETLGRAAQRLDGPLNSVDSVVSWLASACAPVACVSIPTAGSIGAVAAADVRSSVPAPVEDVALIDGRAFSSGDLIGASSMSPAVLLTDPPRVAVGDHLPAGCDCVIDADLVTGHEPMFEAHGGGAPGEGVRRRGEDLPVGALLLRAGERISPLTVLALDAAGVLEIPVRRARVRIVAVPHDSVDGSSARAIAALTIADGANASLVTAPERSAHAIADAVSSEAWDAVFIVGGSGLGADDHAIDFLRERGVAIAHGVALDPGRTLGAGMVDGAPVLCMPGRFDGALAAYLAFGLPLLRRLTGAHEPPPAPILPLTRKIASSVGLSQIALLEAGEDGWAPLAVGAITLSHLLRAQAWTMIPEGSEGLPQGAQITPHQLPGRSATS